MSMSWHGTGKGINKNPGDNRIFENTEQENNFEVEIVGRNAFVILNHVNLSHISTNSNHSNNFGSNNAN